MATMGRLARSLATLLESEHETGERFVDLCISLRVADVVEEGGKKRWDTATETELIRVGGRWDRARKRWDGHARKARVIRVHRGQERAARWLADWFRRRASGDWSGFRRVWSALFLGGRRGGKSHLACVALVMFCVLQPRARVWAVSPTQEETDELEQAIRDLLPRRWYRFRGSGAGKVVTFKLPHGGRIQCLSGHKPRALKRGRVDFCLYNEGQNMARAGYVQLRGAVADRGGLVLIAANPPDSAIGRWIEEHYERAQAGKIACEVFDFDPSKNPWIEYAVLESLRDEVDELTFRREVLGHFVPIGDVVFHAWLDSETWRDPTADLVDVTVDFTRRHLGRAFGYIVGADFQKTPHMAAAVIKAFADPALPEAEPTLWIVDEVVVENADEDDLVDALEAQRRWTPQGRIEEGYRGWALPDDDDPEQPVHCCVIADASGWFQDGAHTKGRTSDQALRARRWTWLYKPQADSDRNPDVVERCKVTNARLKSAAGRRRLFVARHCLRVAEAMRRWENRNGVPYRRSDYAHVCDATTYPVYRFFGRPKVRNVKFGDYRGVRRITRREQFRGT